MQEESDVEPVSESRELDTKKYRFFLEEVSRRLHVRYYIWYALVTVLLEASRLAVEYLTIVEKLGLSTGDLVAHWSRRWLIFLWFACMLVMYYSMNHLRGYNLHALERIRPRLRDYPRHTLRRVFCSRTQHLIPLCLVVLCAFYFANIWHSNTIFGFYSATGVVYEIPVREIPIHFIQLAIWITYDLSVGGYFSWMCLGTIMIIHGAAKQTELVDVFHHDRAGGLGVMGSLAMRTALLFVLAITLAFPGWIVHSFPQSADPMGFALQIAALSALALMEMGVFVLPMLSFHGKMKKGRELQLTKLDGVIAGFHSSLLTNSLSEEDHKRFEDTLTLRRMAESMHEFPFDLRMLAKVSGSAFLPPLSVIGQRILEFVLSSV